MSTELRKCSRCHSTIHISYFGVNKKKEPNKTCDNCRKTCNKKKEMEKLPDEAKRLIYEYDNTYREKFKDVMTELTNRMKRFYIQQKPTYSEKSIYKKEIYPIAPWVCEIRLRRKSKKSKYLIKKSYPLRICGDVIYPLEHNRKACELNKKNTFKEFQNTARWKTVVEEYICQTAWLIHILKSTNGRPLRLLN